jgi:hypothetical protein
MTNRYLVAKTLNHGDELVWLHKHKDMMLKCIWRRSCPLEGNSTITFLAIIMKRTDSGMLVESGTYSVYTRILT